MEATSSIHRIRANFIESVLVGGLNKSYCTGSMPRRTSCNGAARAPATRPPQADKSKPRTGNARANSQRLQTAGHRTLRVAFKESYSRAHSQRYELAKSRWPLGPAVAPSPQPGQGPGNAAAAPKRGCSVRTHSGILYETCNTRTEY